MHPGLAFILGRLNADFADAGLGVISFVSEPEPDWAGPVFAYLGEPDHGESRSR
jgi:hypothetical protein